ncbi:hypothetical protein FV218_14150 [Methylobacterium sp. WL69]|nr:hypothetical protein FV218_14150 [Methylobacterium sp. WL69]
MLACGRGVPSGGFAGRGRADEPRRAPASACGSPWLVAQSARAHPLSPPAGRGPQAPRRACGERRRSRSDGEGAIPDESHADSPPHLRLPPRSADDKVGRALSPQAGRGDARGGRACSTTLFCGGFRSRPSFAAP